MHIKSTIFTTLLILVSVSSFKSFGLTCSSIPGIQKQFLKSHILYSSITPQIKKRVLNQFLKNLDPDKIYFLQSDINSIQSRQNRFLKNIENKNCSDLYHIYNLYSKRVKERTDFSKKYLKNNFKLNKRYSFIVDEDLKKYPKSEKEAISGIKKWVQYQVANVYTVEEDLKKSVNHISIILNNKNKQVQSWKPKLNPQEKRACAKKSENSFKACKPSKWLSHYLTAFALSLDSHSGYLDNEAIEDFRISMNLSLEGIGATLSSRFGYTVVENLVPGGAAFKSKKLKRKDKILEVGQTKNNFINIFGERIEDVVSIIRGKKGTSVYLKILREEKKSGKKKTFVVKLIREKVKLTEDEASLYYVKRGNEKIAIIQVPSFYGSHGGYGKSVTRDVKKLIAKTSKKNISSMVLDLSNNRGGSLDEAVNLSGLFFARGNVVKQSEKNRGKPTLLKDRNPEIAYSGPLVVLVNRLSASASEIVSGTLKDYKRAIVVGGDHTFGKGSVQSVEHLDFKLGALKTTVGLYFIPSGQSTQKQGVVSDIPLPSIFNIDDIGEKNLDYALPQQTIANFQSSDEIFSNNVRKNWKPLSSQMIATLKNFSKRRVSKSKDFQKIITKLKKVKDKIKNKKTITVAEILDNKDKDDDEEDLKDKDDDGYNAKKKAKNYMKRADVQEAVNIANDLSLLFKKQTSLKSAKRK